MPDPDMPLAVPGDVAEAIALLTRLPVRARTPRGGAAAWAYPLAGLTAGAVAALVAAAAGGLPPAITAGLALTAMVALTGALHEDGLADSADGLWGGWTVQRRLEIMKDSRVGTYGVIALVLSLGLRWAALTTLAAAGGLTLVLIAAGVLSRAPMLAIMGALPHARSTGLSATVGRPGSDTVLLGLGLSGLAGFALLGFGILPLAALLFVTTLAIARIAKARIDGQTGDILGATQQISEIAILIYLAA